MSSETVPPPHKAQSLQFNKTISDTSGTSVFAKMAEGVWFAKLHSFSFLEHILQWQNWRQKFQSAWFSWVCSPGTWGGGGGGGGADGVGDRAGEGAKHGCRSSP